MADDEQTGSDVWAPWRSRISAAKKRREDLVASWQENVARRRGATTETVVEGDTPVNQDWALTKAKIAQLYSQTPEVRLTPKDARFQPVVQLFGAELNTTIEDISVGSTIEENLADVSNASGIGATLVSCEKRTETREVPAVDPALLPPGQVPPMMPVEAVVDLQYLVRRISPADLLIPSDFTGSNYDHARWLAHDARMTWTQALASKLVTEEQKDDVLSTDSRAKASQSLNTDTTKFRDTEVVNYTEVFYWRHFYHAEETSFKALQRLVFVEGVEEPVINEPYQVQQRTPEGKLVGVMRNPIRVLTLTYISDDSLPPSDSTISRFQVKELEASRDAMVQQRKHSIPIRWGDNNRISPNAKAKIDKGDYQSFIWTNGPGDRALGVVDRANHAPEKFEFDKIIKNDLSELWQVGTNQAGAFASGERSAREAGIVEKNFQRRVGQEQDKVQKYFLGIVEVLAAHMALYGTFTLPDALGPLRAEMANAFNYSIRVDDTVRKDADEQIERLTKGLNLTAQSGFVNIKPVVAKIWSLLGENPEEVVIDPQPKSPEPVKISISKAEDIINPVMLATLFATGQAPGPDALAAAVKLLQEALAGGVPLVPPTPPSDQPGEVERPAMAHGNWDTSPRIERRAEDGGA